MSILVGLCFVAVFFLIGSVITWGSYELLDRFHDERMICAGVVVVANILFIALVAFSLFVLGLGTVAFFS